MQGLFDRPNGGGFYESRFYVGLELDEGLPCKSRQPATSSRAGVRRGRPPYQHLLGRIWTKGLEGHFLSFGV